MNVNSTISFNALNCVRLFLSTRDPQKNEIFALKKGKIKQQYIYKNQVNADEAFVHAYR